MLNPRFAIYTLPIKLEESKDKESASQHNRNVMVRAPAPAKHAPAWEIWEIIRSGVVISFSFGLIFEVFWNLILDTLMHQNQSKMMFSDLLDTIRIDWNWFCEDLKIFIFFIQNDKKSAKIGPVLREYGSSGAEIKTLQSSNIYLDQVLGKSWYSRDWRKMLRRPEFKNYRIEGECFAP